MIAQLGTVAEVTPKPGCQIVETDTEAKLIHLELVSASAPHTVLTEVGVGTAFRVRVLFNHEPEQASERVELRNLDRGGEITVLAHKTDIGRIFLSDPVTVREAAP